MPSRLYGKAFLFSVSFIPVKKFLSGFIVVSVLVVVAVVFLSWKMKRDAIETYNRYVANAPYDVIIVPGLPYDTGRQNILLKVRMLWAKSLFDKGITKNIIFSGGAVHTAYIEGKVMKTIADSLGIPAEHTFAEDKAEHGNENIYYSKKLAQQSGFKKIALATDQYQNSFLSSFMEELMTGVAQLPVNVDSFTAYDKELLPAVDVRGAFINNFIPLNERQSRWERLCASLRKEIGEENQ